MGKNPDLSDKDKQVLLMAWSACNRSAPSVDYNKLAELCGYGSTASATTVYHGAKKKLFALNGITEFGGTVAAGAAGDTPKKATVSRKSGATPKSGGGKKRGVSAVADADDEEQKMDVKPKKMKTRIDLQEGDNEEVKPEVKEEPTGEGLDELRGAQEFGDDDELL